MLYWSVRRIPLGALLPSQTRGMLFLAARFFVSLTSCPRFLDSIDQYWARTSNPKTRKTWKLPHSFYQPTRARIWSQANPPRNPHGWQMSGMRVKTCSTSEQTATRRQSLAPQEGLRQYQHLTSQVLRLSSLAHRSPRIISMTVRCHAVIRQDILHERAGSFRRLQQDTWTCIHPNHPQYSLHPLSSCTDSCYSMFFLGFCPPMLCACS